MKGSTDHQFIRIESRYGKARGAFLNTEPYSESGVPVVQQSILHTTMDVSRYRCHSVHSQILEHGHHSQVSDLKSAFNLAEHTILWCCLSIKGTRFHHDKQRLLGVFTSTVSLQLCNSDVHKNLRILMWNKP